MRFWRFLPLSSNWLPSRAWANPSVSPEATATVMLSMSLVKIMIAGR